MNAPENHFRGLIPAVGDPARDLLGRLVIAVRCRIVQIHHQIIRRRIDGARFYFHRQNSRTYLLAFRPAEGWFPINAFPLSDLNEFADISFESGDVVPPDGYAVGQKVHGDDTVSARKIVCHLDTAPAALPDFDIGNFRHRGSGPDYGRSKRTA